MRTSSRCLVQIRNRKSAKSPTRPELATNTLTLSPARKKSRPNSNPDPTRTRTCTCTQLHQIVVAGIQPTESNNDVWQSDSIRRSSVSVPRCVSWWSRGESLRKSCPVAARTRRACVCVHLSSLRVRVSEVEPQSVSASNDGGRPYSDLRSPRSPCPVVGRPSAISIRWPAPTRRRRSVSTSCRAKPMGLCSSEGARQYLVRSQSQMFKHRSALARQHRKWCQPWLKHAPIAPFSTPDRTSPPT